MKFTFDSYIELINLLRNEGYNICLYCNHNSFDLPVILRHDVDFSLEKALKFAKIEKSLNIKSTYFILVSTDFYNVFSKKSKEIISEILSMGHNIGLHFDEMKYSKRDRESGVLVEHMQKEANILSVAIKNKVDTISMHRPSNNTLKADYKINKLTNSYGKEFYEEFKYISDSRMNWREDVLSIIKSHRYKRLQILTHPIWYEEKERSIKDIIRDFVNNANIQRYEYIDKNLQNFSDVLKREEI